MKEALCKLFCADLHIVPVPVGFAVSHSAWEFGGDEICVYLIGPSSGNLWMIQDDGTTVPYLEATGTDLDVPARQQMFQRLLEDYRASYNENSCELKCGPFKESDAPRALFRFFQLITRIQDMAISSRDRVEDLWVEELERDLEKAIDYRAKIQRKDILAPELSDYPVDLVIRADGRQPVAVYFGVSDAKAYEALLLRTQAKYHFNIDSPVILVLRDDRSISQRQRLRADANLIVPRYRGAERDTIGRIVEEATGRRPEMGLVH